MRDFALYGETTGEVDEFGLPVRADWAAQYRGVTTYQDVAAIMGLPQSGSHMGRELGLILGEIASDEIEEVEITFECDDIED